MSAKAALDSVYFSINLTIYVAQIGNFEGMYRDLDGHVNCLLPYIGMPFDNINVQQ